MDVNQVRFGMNSVGANATSTKGKDAKAEEKANDEVKTSVAKEASPESVMSALSAMGSQNLAFVSVAPKKEVNPADYISPERASDIEAMMANFEVGVNEIVFALEDEFSGMLSDESKYALAASIFEKQ